MSDQDKSKEQLIEELKDMRLKMAELEAVQKSLNKKESRYREMVDETSAAIFVIQDGHVKFVNNATMELTGYSTKEDLSSPAIETFVHPDDRDMVNQYHIRRLQGDNAPFRYDYRFVCKDGTVKWAEMNSSLIMWEGEPAGLCLVTDITERKRVEEALRSNEEKFRTLFETANDAIFLMDGEKFIKCNAKAAQMYGCEGEKDIVGHTPMEFSPDEQPDGLDSMEGALKYKNAASDSGPQTFYWKHCRKDGSTFDVEVSLNALTLSGNAHFLAIVRDITERKRVEEALQKSEIVHRTLCENIPGIVYRVGLDEPVTMEFFNSTVHPITGFTETELTMGKVCSIDPLIVEEDRARVVDVVKQALSEDKPFEVEYRIRHKSGAIRHLGEYGRPIKSLTGEHSYIDGVIFDDTERKQAEEALRTSEERFRKMFERHSAAMFLIEPETGRIIDANKAAERFYGYAASQLLSMSIQDINALPPEDVEAQRNLAVQERRNHFIFPHRLASGEVRTVEVHSSPIEQNGTLLLFAIIHDITDRKRLEEERLEMERKVLHAQKLESLNVMAGGIAHDFNNQLAVVLGNLELALTDRILNPKARLSIESAVEAAKRSAGLSRQMQSYTGNTLYYPVDLDLNELLNRNPSQLKLCVSKNVTLNPEIYNTLPPIQGDPDQILRLVLNILVNASEAICDNMGDVTLRTGVMDCDEAYLSRSRLEEKPAPGRFVFLEVKDTGCGMDAETQRRLFDPFFTTKFWGRGLGMAEVIGIVKGLHGTIIVESEVGKGTTISVLFPALAKVQAMDVVETEAPVPDSVIRRKTILIVEDETGVRNLTVKRLEALGYDTIIAVDGEEGVSVFRKRLNEIDLVILDFKMPKMDGVEVFVELIRIKPDVKVIVCSGYTEDVVIERFPGQRPAGVLHKPYDMDILKAELERLLGSNLQVSGG